MTPKQLQAKLSALLSQHLADEDLLQLLREVLREGGGLTVEMEDLRCRIVERDGHFSLKHVDRKRPSTIPPYR